MFFFPGPCIHLRLLYLFSWYLHDADDLAGSDKERETEDVVSTFSASEQRLYSKGLQLYREGDYAKALSFFQQAMDAGNPNAANDIGWMYRRGLGVKQDDSQAFQYYREAAQKNNPTALHNVAFMYEHGLGVKKNEDLAFKYYSKSVKEFKLSCQKARTPV